MEVNGMLTQYLDAAVDMGFEGSAFVEDGILYLCGDAKRMLYEELDASGVPDVSKDDDGIEWNMFPVDKVRWEVMDLEESVPAKTAISEDHVLCMRGPAGCGLSGGEFDDFLLEPVDMDGVDDFRKLFPLVVDVLVGDLPEEEMKKQTAKLSDFMRLICYERQGITQTGDGTGR